MEYVTVEELRGQLADVKEKVAEELLAPAVVAASRAVEDWTGRSTFGLADVATARLLRPTGPEVTDVPDIGALDGLVVETRTGRGAEWRTLDPDDYQLEPLDAPDRPAYTWTQLAALSGPWPRVGRRPSLRVTARWGWSSVPEQVKRATLLRAVALYKRRDSPLGVAGFGDFGAMRITRQDSDVVALLAPFQRVMAA
ncbi:hypothetical protein amrb99_97720 [Actinomadura sp. RB99]|nr:hypothetical protein [Actinomadura sp. RB99]